MRIPARLGLGLLVAGAVFPVAARVAHAQVRPDTSAVSVAVPPRPDSIRVDSTPPADDRRRARRDSVQRAYSRSEEPAGRDSTNVLRWTREEMFASGAITLLDLLDRIPGVTGLRAGWVLSPMTAVYSGRVGAVRLFYDGIELDPLDARLRGAHDLSRLPLWTLESVVVERGADELRVHVRSWQTDRLTPFTRVDVSTGDEDTNLFRGYFGRRFGNGAGMQVGAQQLSATTSRGGVDGGGLGLLLRAGWSRGQYSADGYVLRARTDRTRQRNSRFNAADVAGQDATHSLGYLRAGYGAQGDPLWVQLIAASQEHSETTPNAVASAGVPADSADTTRSRAQYVIAAGLRRGPLSLSATHRMRVFEGITVQTPSARASADFSRVSASAFVERGTVDSTSRAEIALSATPLAFVRLSGAVSRTTPARNRDGGASTTSRGEASVGFRGVWIGGGAIRTDSLATHAPVVFDTAFRSQTRPALTMPFVTLRARLPYSLYVDGFAVRAPEDARDFVPEYQTRAEVGFVSTFPKRFPSGNFELRAVGIHEYRSSAAFPRDGRSAIFSSGSRVVSTLLEIRIVSAIVSWQYRNVIGEDYDLVPGLIQPRQTNFYGVRWEFFN